jgi:glc operon protein GlcG
MHKYVALLLVPAMTMCAADLPSKKYLNLAAIKTMVAASESKAKELNVGVTICIVDESGNLLFLEKGDGASLNTLQFAQKKARDAAAYGSPSREAAESVKKGKTLLFLISFPTRAGCRSGWMASSSEASRPAAQSLKLTNKLPKQGWTRS